MTKPEDTSKVEKKKETVIVTDDLKCGIIMPISEHPDYPANHWNDVLNVLNEAISETSFKPNLVSNDEAIGLIHERIVTNIYNNQMIVCDVSSKNPNVMFELGLRLAFDKPVIIIKDDKTSYSFDTGNIEHINYPSSLRFSVIVAFKKELAKKIDATYKRATETINFSPFLKSFGKTIIPAKIEGGEITESKFIIDQLAELKDDFRRIAFNLQKQPVSGLDPLRNTTRAYVRDAFRESINVNGIGAREEVEELVVARMAQHGNSYDRPMIRQAISEYMHKKLSGDSME